MGIERTGLVKGEERAQLDLIRSQLDGILRKLETMPCEIP
jgi:hypothetical protein